MAEAQELDLSLFPSETKVLWRSEIRLSGYNPRVISQEGRKHLKRSIKNFGVIGGLVVNAGTGNTVVSGHQKIKLLDEKYGYSESNPSENDYRLKVEMIDVDEKTEKELNIMFNNPNVGGTWDNEALARMIPDIDYKKAGLEEADLSLIGLDYILKTEGENQLSDALDGLMSPVREKKESEKKARKVQRDAERAAAAAEEIEEDEESDVENDDREAKVAHMKDVKKQVREAAVEKAQNMDAYLMISFDTFKAKADFCRRLGFDEYARFIKGEEFDSMIEIAG